MKQWAVAENGSLPPFQITADREDFLVISKAPGISFHQKEGAGEGMEPSLAERLRRATGLSALYPVHRLDEITSGLMVFAKNPVAARNLSEAFSGGRVEKYYLALGEGRPSKVKGLVCGDLVRSRRGMWKLTRTLARPARTQFVSSPVGDGRRLFLLHPLTGLTHQLRVTLKALGSPVLGDPLYGDRRDHWKKPAYDRAYLHAWALCFPWEGKVERFLQPPAQGTFFHSPEAEGVMAGWSPPWEQPWPQTKTNPGQGPGLSPGEP